MQNKKVKYAVVGLGYIAQAAVLPAFRNAKKNSELVSLISDDPQKLSALSRKYKTKLNGDYADFEDILNRGEIDAVYIALPNHLHREYVERAAEAGVHILCEKPMAVTVEECESMLSAVEANGVKLMIAYRLHFERANLKAVSLIERGKIGSPKYFASTFSMQVKEGNIRTNPIEQGGGTLYDIGIYCLNAARYLFQSEPIEVFAMSATSSERRFESIDESTIATLRFPEDRLATFVSSFGSADQAVYKVVGTKGSLEVQNAYEWQSPITHRLRIGEREQRTRFPKRDQFAPELIYFSDCILNDKQIEPSAEEGLRDVEVIQALYESARTGRVISMQMDQEKMRPRLSQEIRRPSQEKVKRMVHVQEPFK